MRSKPDRLTVDEARLMPRFRAVFDRIELRQHQATVLSDEISRALGDGNQATPPRKTPAGGDPMALRGIPAIGRGASGAITGTRPGDRI